jgi:hypothetical protein
MDREQDAQNRNPAKWILGEKTVDHVATSER